MTQPFYVEEEELMHQEVKVICSNPPGYLVTQME